MLLASARSRTKARRLSQRKAANNGHRLFLCAQCSTPVRLCRSCDRGQRSCSAACSAALRTTTLRRSGNYYQSTERGRARHAARQRAYRLRNKAAALIPAPVPSPPMPLAPTASMEAVQLLQPPTPPDALAPVALCVPSVSGADLASGDGSARIPAQPRPGRRSASSSAPPSVSLPTCHRCGGNPSLFLHYGPLREARLRPFQRRRRRHPVSSPPPPIS